MKPKPTTIGEICHAINLKAIEEGNFYWRIHDQAKFNGWPKRHAARMRQIQRRMREQRKSQESTRLCPKNKARKTKDKY